jgi:hypothetical protein
MADRMVLSAHSDDLATVVNLDDPRVRARIPNAFAARRWERPLVWAGGLCFSIVCWFGSFMVVSLFYRP